MIKTPSDISGNSMKLNTKFVYKYNIYINIYIYLFIRELVNFSGTILGTGPQLRYWFFFSAAGGGAVVYFGAEPWTIIQYAIRSIILGRSHHSYPFM